MRGRSVWYNYSYYGQPITAVYIMRRRRRRPHPHAHTRAAVYNRTHLLLVLNNSFPFNTLLTKSKLSISHISNLFVQVLVGQLLKEYLINMKSTAVTPCCLGGRGVAAECPPSLFTLPYTVHETPVFSQFRRGTWQ